METLLTYVSANGTSLAPTFEGTGITGLDLTRGSGIVSAAGSTFNSSGWNDSANLVQAIANNDFLQWGFSSAIPYDLSDLDIRYDRSGTGPNQIEIQVSVDGGGTFLPFFSDSSVNESSENNADINLASFTNISSAIFRLYGFGATASAGTFDIENTIDFNNNGIVLSGTPSSGGGGGTTLAIAATDANKAEGDLGVTPFTFTITRSGDSAGATSVDFAVTGNTADAVDFGGAFPAGTLNFAAGETSQVVTVNVSGDTDPEPDEAFTVTLSNPSGSATITTATANGTIQNDDGIAITPISAIQGSGAASPIVGSQVTIEAVVVGDFQDGTSGTNGDLNGFFVQEQDTDVDGIPATSEGLFIFDGNSPAVNVNIGDTVQITGIVTEFNGLTELMDVSVAITGTDSLPTPATVNFPVTAVDDLEAFEGMQVTIPETLFVTEYFNLDRFGEILLSSDGASNQPGTDGRLDQFTQFNDPSVPGFAVYQDAIASRRIVLDDGQTVQNPDPIILGRGGNPLSATNTLRGGDTVDHLSGILSFGFDEYRIQPVAPVDFQPTNPRPATPDVGGDLKVASFNVLNYFTTFDQRGADNAQEFQRQRDKIINAIVELDADVVGLIELENNGDTAIGDLVDGINTELGSSVYDFISTGVVGTDQITVGLIYKSAAVTPIGEEAILDKTVDPRFDSDNQRPTIAQTFEEVGTGEALTVAVNHFKSKGSVIPGDEDQNDGQGSNNSTRTLAAEALVDWLATDPTDSGDSDVLIIGDLNAYAQEDPVTTIEDAGYTNLIEAEGYSFVFDGQFGALDHALANTSLTAQVTGAAEWHINVDEPDALDYNTNFRSPGQIANLYSDSPFRSSDHDPLIVGLDLSSPNGVPTAVDDTFTTDEDTAFTTGNVLANDADPDNDTLSVVSVDTSRTQGLVTDNGDGTFGYDPNGQFAALNTGETATDSFSYTISDGKGGESTASVAITINGLDEDSPVNVIDGTRNDDNIVGTNADDLIRADNGNDRINARNGNDTVEGGRGGDSIQGGAGDDVLAADRVDRFDDFDGEISRIFGGTGNDLLIGGGKADLLRGGNDNDTLLGKGGDDQLFGDGGDDLLNGDVGNDLLSGGGSTDTADYSDLVINGVFGTIAGLDVNLRTRTALHSSTNNALTWTDRLISIENVTGTQRNDRFIGNGQNNVFDGQGEVGRNDRQTQFTDLRGSAYTVTADVVEYRGSSSQFSVAGTADNLTVTGQGEGTDILLDIEFIKFSDALFAVGDLL
ncbi:MAG: ExeM/NucH family extracellular endonuclease [Oscillatoriales cyanobacterium RM2_1_1]|nr:ExeM/NucH family extracellular endonuclease [Oscillatoriales cyanobacterium SM2_3_0]NJO47494.1 ExeM/NucH family extracellular endonuclease [Oscillatoriales cyanobacterium RM2_1_1]